MLSPPLPSDPFALLTPLDPLSPASMPLLTFVARASDALLLVASFEHSLEAATADPTSMDMYKSQAKQLLKKLDGKSVAKCSIESGNW